MSLTKRLDQAREAFARKDLAASAAAHQLEVIARAVEPHGGASHQYIGDMVYGGLDGIVTTFAVVSGVPGAKLGADAILPACPLNLTHCQASVRLFRPGETTFALSLS